MHRAFCCDVIYCSPSPAMGWNPELLKPNAQKFFKNSAHLLLQASSDHPCHHHLPLCWILVWRANWCEGSHNDSQSTQFPSKPQLHSAEPNQLHSWLTWRFFFLWNTMDFALTFLSLISTLLPHNTMGIFSHTRTRSLCQLGTFL